MTDLNSSATSASSASAVSAAPIDTQFLESLIGYNARRAALVIIEQFLKHMAVHELRPVSFSVLSLIKHNPGITSSQLCATLGILPPNLVGLIKPLVKRTLIERRPHPHDGRAMALHLTSTGLRVMTKAERTATELELQVSDKLSTSERKNLLKLLKKVYA
jgi:DNA-binding MarR family transcriptional regulator